MKIISEKNMTLKENLLTIYERIDSAKVKSGSAEVITLIGVTKTLPVQVIRDSLECGIINIGESRIQEAEKKFTELSGLNFTRHLIGHLQENKANKAAQLFDWVQSIDSLETALKLSRKCGELNKSLKILIEVNTSGDVSKFGIHPDETAGFAGKLLELPHLDIRGLMTIGPLDKPLSEARKSFASLYTIRENLKTLYPAVRWEHLSMGMSADFRAAIAEGATLVRIGTAIFGERTSAA